MTGKRPIPVMDSGSEQIIKEERSFIMVESRAAQGHLSLFIPEQKMTVALVANVFRAPLFEGEAETIAGYFLDDYSYNIRLPEEVLKFTSTNNDKLVNGEINLKDRKVAGITSQALQIADIVQDGDKVRIIAPSSSGIINIWLREENGKYSGKWGYDKETIELIFE